MQKKIPNYLTLIVFLLFNSFLLAQTEDPLRPNWQKYHNTADAYMLLEGWAKAYPNLTALYSIGETLKGTPLMVLEITNKEAGAAAEKPGYYYDGNIHAGELTAAEVALHFAWHLLSNYESDERIKQLVDSHTIYIRPKFNPDGADLALNTPTILRSTPRPYDEDQDGLLDEDPGNDLNGDGVITDMRIRNDGSGAWKISPDDPRIMLAREAGELTGEFYEIIEEGTDDDGDGQYNEDGIGGIDMNRNFPRNWGLEYEQAGAGPYPLSEPETRATIEFIHSHRNITGVFHGHTAGGFVFRLPSTTSWNDFNMADQRLILELSDKYEETTGQSAQASYSNPRVHRHGTLISWSYWDFGVVAFVPEFWGGFGEDFDKDGRVSAAERFRWNDEQLKGSGFVNWKSYRHPQLGEVEIGGWKNKFTRQNPPLHLLKGEIEKYVPWMLWLSEISPRIILKEMTTQIMEDGEMARIKLQVVNEGYLSTNITQRALDAQIATPVRVLLDLAGAELVTGKARTEIGHLKGRRDHEEGSADNRHELEYMIRLTGKDPVVKITVESEKGGTARGSIKIKSEN